MIISTLALANSIGTEDCGEQDCNMKEDGNSLLQIKINTAEDKTNSAQARCETVMGRAPASISYELVNSSYNVCTQQVTYLTNADFTGTYIITSPGIYQLTEDIIMGDHCEENGFMPLPNSTMYPPEEGYWLGFFAAIAVASNNVFLDLNQKTISMSREMLVRQRFFSIIELGKRPFKAATGPPQFAHLTTEFPVARNFVVTDGTLGLSSHMGIHGVDNTNIWIDQVTVRDFETGGIQLNGARNVHISNTEVGPSLGYYSHATQAVLGKHGAVPGMATLSQAFLLLRVAAMEGVDQEPAIVELANSVEAFTEAFLAGEDFEEREQVFVNLDKVPDGSAMYGILFVAAKIAIHDFAACGISNVAADTFGPLNLTNVNISRLKLKTDEVIHITALSAGVRKPVMGPAGDLFQFFRLRNNSGHYVGNVLSDAQIALGGMKREEVASGPSGDESVESFERYIFEKYGATNIPEAVVTWSTGAISFEEMNQTISAEPVCEKDAMNHHNKGVIGLRIEQYSSVNLHNIKTERLENVGQQSEVVHCTDDDSTYKGNDARGITLTQVTNACMNNVRYDDIRSINGYAYGVEERHQVNYSSSGDNCQDYHISGIYGSMGSTNRAQGSSYTMLDSDSNSDSDSNGGYR